MDDYFNNRVGVEMIDFYTDLETEEVRYEPRDIRWNLNHRILTREEIQELLVLNQSGDQDARDQLVECNMQLIWSFAKRYGAEHNLIDELMADGVIAFLQSADKYDLEQYKIESYHKTHPFIGYASTNIDRAIRNSNQLDDLVALPDYLKRLKGRVAKARYELLTEDIQNPTNNQIADYIIEHLNDSKYRYSKDQVLKYLEGFHKRDIIGLRNHVLSDSNLLYEDIIGVEDPSFRFIEERDYFDHILEYLDLDEKRIFCHSVGG